MNKKGYQNLITKSTGSLHINDQDLSLMFD